MPHAAHQNPHPGDTIAAVATAPAGALRGVLRMTGPSTLAIVERLFLPAGLPGTGPWHAPRRASRIEGSMHVAAFFARVPVDLHVWPGGRSYTGQPLAELHAVGSPPVLEAMLSELQAAGARMALPGEFTLRAFLTGRIDLVQAEAVLGVIEARDPAELARALEQLGGGVSHQVAALRAGLLDLLGDLEAGLDFSDEGLEFVAHDQLVARLRHARQELRALWRRAQARLPSGELPRVVLAGPPNAGKSTLFNALAGERRALVSPLAGTTRDYLSADVDCDGVAVRLIDTAGCDLRAQGADQLAQVRREALMQEAELVVWCQPASGGRPPGSRGATLPIRTMCDLDPSGPAAPPRGAGLRVSAVTGQGLAELRSAIAGRLRGQVPEGGLLGTTAARCRQSLRAALRAVRRGLRLAREERDQLLLAIELREALDALGQVVGAVYTDELLDNIFGKFCIGK